MTESDGVTTFDTVLTWDEGGKPQSKTIVMRVPNRGETFNMSKYYERIMRPTATDEQKWRSVGAVLLTVERLILDPQDSAWLDAMLDDEKITIEELIAAMTASITPDEKAHEPAPVKRVRRR